jgi:GTP-binding protein HflX
VTEKLFSELGAVDKPTLCVFNKCDREGEQIPAAPASLPKENVFYVSAKTGQNVEALVARLGELVNESTARLTFAIPMARQDVVAKLYRFARVEEVSYDDENTLVTAVCDGRAKGMFREWIKE